MSLSAVGLTVLSRVLRGRTLGFTSVVPNPDISQLPLVREFERAADTVGAEAVSFEGLAAYLHLRICAEALARMAKPEPARLASAIESLGTLDMGGLRVRFGPQQHLGSEYVEIGVLGRDGKLRR